LIFETLKTIKAGQDFRYLKWKSNLLTSNKKSATCK
jgi:hypothetical protein